MHARTIIHVQLPTSTWWSHALPHPTRLMQDYEIYIRMMYVHVAVVWLIVAALVWLFIVAGRADKNPTIRRYIKYLQVRGRENG